MREVDQQILNRTMAVVRHNMPSYRWADYAEAIVGDRRSREGHLRKPDPELDRRLFGALETFRTTGVLEIPDRVGREVAEAMRRHLEASPVHRGAHTLSYVCTPKPLEEARRESQLVGYSMTQLLRTPGLIDVLNQPAIIDFIERYLGCVPTLYSLNAWWSFPSANPEQVNVQYFHRDTDDWRFCALFLYLTDVDLLGGPHQVIEGSQTLAGMQSLLDRARDRGQDVAGFDAADSFVHSIGQNFSARCEDLFRDATVSLTGPAGSMFLVNTLALHRGLVPSQSPRLMVWARYGLGPNTNSADQEQGPLCRAQLVTDLPDTPRNRYINRLLFEFDRGPF